MSVPAVEELNCLAAWQAGARLLLESGNDLSNLISVIHNPCVIDPVWLINRSPHNFSASGDNIRNVVNTIFPNRLAGRLSSRTDLYTTYLKCHDRARKWGRGPPAWGTYFERLIRFPNNVDGRPAVNQLERSIEKLLSWKHRSTTGLVFHLSSPAIDSPRTRGGPCWHYGELLWNRDGTIDFVAVYRNHDFYNKVLGNFIGLGLLLKFICDESGKTAGRLICHSVHAYCDGASRQALNDMAA